MVVRFHVRQTVRVIDTSNMRGQLGEIRRKGYGVWWVWLEALGREVPFDETEIEPVEQERNDMDEEQVAAWIEQLNANPDADLDGTTLRVNEALAPFGKQMGWDDERQTYSIVPMEDE